MKIGVTSDRREVIETESLTGTELLKKINNLDLIKELMKRVSLLISVVVLFLFGFIKNLQLSQRTLTNVAPSVVFIIGLFYLSFALASGLSYGLWMSLLLFFLPNLLILFWTIFELFKKF